MAQLFEMSLPAPRARRTHVVLLAMSVALIASGIAGLRIVQPLRSAEEVFGLAQEFVESHHSAHFEGTVSGTAEPEDEDDEPETIAGRVSGEFDDRVGSHTFSSSAEEGVDETIVIGKDTYWRYADTEAALAAERFAKETYDEDDEFAGFFGAMSFGAEAAQPGADGLDEVFEYGVDPAIVSRGDGATVVRVDLDSEELFGLMGKKLDVSMTITMTVEDSGALRKYRMEADFMGSKLDSTLTFSEWGKPVDIKAPEASMVDETPDVDEEGVSAWTGAPLYVPTSIPEGWSLTWAEILSEEDSGEDCEQVEIDFDSPEDEEDYLSVYLYELPTACAPPLDDDMEPFRAGPYVGGIEVDEDGYTYVQIRIDDKTTLQAEGDLSEADMVTLLSSLQPLSFPPTFSEFALTTTDS